MRISDWSSDVCSSDLIVAGLEKDAVAPRDVGPQCQHSAAQGRLIFSAESDVPLGRVGQPLAFEAFTGIVKIDIVARIEISDRRCERRSEEHTSELQSIMRNSYAVLCLKKINKLTLTN